MNSATDEGENEFAGIGHVAGDVEEILEEPDPGNGEGNGVTFTPKGNHENGGEDELTEGSAIDFQSPVEKTEKRMACFVKKEIGEIEQWKETRLGFKDDSDNDADRNEEGDETWAGDGVPAFVGKFIEA